jgi:hypothetical protein
MAVGVSGLWSQQDVGSTTMPCVSCAATGSFLPQDRDAQQADLTIRLVRLSGTRLRRSFRSPGLLPQLSLTNNLVAPRERSAYSKAAAVSLVQGGISRQESRRGSERPENMGQ